MEAYGEYLSADDLVLRAQQGDERAAEQVLTLFRPLAQSVAGRFFVPSYEPEDVCQIALMGLWRAVLCFDPQRKAGFAAFARVCIRRQILSELKRAQRWAVPVVSLSDEADGQAWLEQLPDPRQNLYEQLSERESTAAAARVFDDETQPAGGTGGRVVPAAAHLPRDCRAAGLLAESGGQRAGAYQAQGASVRPR
jgi:RNA polymerase sigma factor (sigma-70 family)